MMNWNVDGSSRVLILRKYLGIRLEGLRKTKKKPPISQSLGRDLNPEPCEYEAGLKRILRKVVILISSVTLPRSTVKCKFVRHKLLQEKI
jgi:hypothetical protein